jgi:hypothetical protein
MARAGKRVPSPLVRRTRDLEASNHRRSNAMGNVCGAQTEPNLDLHPERWSSRPGFRGRLRPQLLRSGRESASAASRPARVNSFGNLPSLPSSDFGFSNARDDAIEAYDLASSTFSPSLLPSSFCVLTVLAGLDQGWGRGGRSTEGRRGFQFSFRLRRNAVALSSASSPSSCIAFCASQSSA